MANDVAPLLGPLLEVLGSGRLLRLVAWPGRVLVDRADGSARVEVAWSAEQHQQAMAALSETITLENGVTARALAGSIILRRPPDPLRRIDDLVGEGRISQLAGRFLTASCGLGRNVLVAGPWGASVELIAALLSEGQRPAVVGRDGDAAPPAWPVLQDSDELLAFGPDRVGIWSLAADELVTVLGGVSGVTAWIDATRLDRALVRFEAGVEQAFEGATAPLQVLAGIDLVVVLGDVGGVRVRQIAEICLAEEGYRPRLLFATDIPPVPTALVPVGAPSYLDDLTRGGHHVLADELRHAVPTEQPVAPPAPAAAPAPPAPELQPQHSEPVRAGPVMTVPAAPTLDPALADAPPPGWELDQLDEEVGGDAITPSAESAALAASFGLGPPPPPPGAAPISSAMVGETEGIERPPSFEEAMARARIRDEEMRQEGDDEEGDPR